MSKEAMKLALEALKKGDYALVNAICEELKQAQPEQEPVAWEMLDGKIVDKWGLQFYAGQMGKPLYTPPQPSKPLTDEEILAVARDHYSPHQRPEISFARAIEAAHGIKGDA